MHPRYPEISNVIFTEVHRALTGEIDPATAIKNMAEKIRRIVGG